jgi:hypothetical protein
LVFGLTQWTLGVKLSPHQARNFITQSTSFKVPLFVFVKPSYLERVKAARIRVYNMYDFSHHGLAVASAFWKRGFGRLADVARIGPYRSTNPPPETRTFFAIFLDITFQHLRDVLTRDVGKIFEVHSFWPVGQVP